MKEYFVPGLFLAGTFVFAYLYLAGPPEGGSQKPTQRGEASIGDKANYGKLQQYRKELLVKKQILKQEALLRKNRDRLDLDPNFHKNNHFHETNLADEIGPAAEDLSRGSYNEPMNLDQRMDAFLAKKQQYEQMEQAQRERFVESFINEAYKMGYVVKVNEAMEVVDVRRIGEN